MLKLSGLNDLLECYHSNVYAEQDCYYFLTRSSMPVIGISG